ncbi:MAG: hypothetical protein ACFCGT_16050 [Sandaracinaceae bacterium]
MADPLVEQLGRILPADGALWVLGSTRGLLPPGRRPPLRLDSLSPPGSRHEPPTAILVADLGGRDALAVARALGPHLRAGGLLVFAVPTGRSGLLGFRRPPTELEDLCEALLAVGMTGIGGWAGTGRRALAWGASSVRRRGD